MTTERTRFLNPSTIHAPSGYSHLAETTGSRTIYLSGQVALSVDGEVVGAGDARLQAEQVFRNLAAALAAVGATFEHVVKLTFFMVDMADFPTVREVRDRFVDTSRPPASSAVQVSGLVFDWTRLEVEAIAVID